MFREEPNCSTCGRAIKGDELVYVKLRYPKRRGMTEIKAYLKNEGRFICEECFQNKNSKS
ncbi:Fe3+ hydroxamate ABC transporter substrate-binding protein [uncultured Metabacillus sp.]|uniref:Fe3+ hydroxamate ABC transporter substrate-binding protein n=1 Tax=uncultured Metabacillus sp. TaxID=2860135 RepID=UPI002602A9AF|nr:Fe3+ hydroxamate ABC transporter substrate-binding protein [uncultured Metabacillus sp.]